MDGMRHSSLHWLALLLLVLVPSLLRAAPPERAAGGADIVVFVRAGCPHCAEAKAFLEQLQARRPELRIELRAVDADPAARDQLQGDFMDCHITSHFQSIWRLDDSARIGREAFVRTHASGGRGVSVWDLFDQAEDDDGVVYLDRLCRTLHAMNFFLRRGYGEPLFLNVHERLLHRVPEEHGHTFARVLHSLGIRAGRVVIELPARLSGSRALLRLLTRNYQGNGFRVALNVPELEEAAELAALTGADIIKLPAPEELESARELAGGVAALRRAGVPLVFTRIAHRDQFERLRAAGAEYGQGFWLDARHEAPPQAV